MCRRYLEDFTVGQTFGSGRLRIDKEQIKAFAAEFDPQPFHLDEDAARDTIFRGLAASGWHTAAVTMRLLVESEIEPAGGIVGAGFDEFRWPRPVRPGYELHIESEVLEVRPSRSRSNQGLIKVRTTTLNQNDEPVQVTPPAWRVCASYAAPGRTIGALLGRFPSVIRGSHVCFGSKADGYSKSSGNWQSSRSSIFGFGSAKRDLRKNPIVLLAIFLEPDTAKSSITLH